ncbi:MAG: acyl-CoA thioesterase, partial [Chitinophagales bacterium]
MPKTLEITVKGFHVDQYHHVNNARYLEFLEEARWYFLEEQFRSGIFKKKGWTLPITEINIKYRQGAH